MNIVKNYSYYISFNISYSQLYTNIYTFENFSWLKVFLRQVLGLKLWNTFSVLPIPFSKSMNEINYTGNTHTRAKTYTTLNLKFTF